jgi:kynurenine formamidase
MSGPVIPKSQFANPPQRGGTVIDLTQIYSPAAPHLPFDQPITRRPAGERERDGFLDYRVDMQEHSGTHIDAPLHFAEGGQSVEMIAADRLAGPLCVIDIRARAERDPDAGLERGDIEAWEGTHGQLPQGAVVAMMSGWGSRYRDNAGFFAEDGEGRSHGPGWSVNAARFLLEARDVIGIGVDTCSIDRLVATGFPVHRLWLGAGRWALENLANLEQVPPAGAFVVVGVPRIAGSTGFPARVIAFC